MTDVQPIVKTARHLDRSKLLLHVACKAATIEQLALQLRSHHVSNGSPDPYVNEDLTELANLANRLANYIQDRYI